MSEGVDRRTFLKAGLAGIVQTLAGSALLAQEPSQASQTLAAALKDYVLAQYDVRLKRSESVAEPVRAKLSAALARAGLETKIADQFDKRENLSTLEAYFEKNSLRFVVLMTGNADFGYMLHRIDSTETRPYTLFNRTSDVKIQTVRDEIIPNITTYAGAQEQNDAPNATLEVAGFCSAESPTVTIFPNKYRTSTKSFIAQVHQHDKEIDEQLRTPDFLDQYIEKPSAFANRAVATTTQDFWKYLGRQLLTLQFRAVEKQFPEQEPLVAALAQGHQHDIELHEVMHAQDSADWSFMKEYSQAIQTELHELRGYHLELRGALSTIAHGRSGWGFAWQTRLLGMPRTRAFQHHFRSAEYIVKKATEYVSAHRKDFPAFTFTAQDYDIAKQFPKLTDDQIKTIATDIFTKTYHGKTLKEYIQGFAPERK